MGRTEERTGRGAPALPFPSWRPRMASHARSRRMEIALAFLLVLGQMAGCITPHDKSGELSRVAKDWCLTVRASQVIPVYPLTRDLRPGDVFVTTVPIGQEVSAFEQKGFLPLDVHM